MGLYNHYLQLDASKTCPTIGDHDMPDFFYVINIRRNFWQSLKEILLVESLHFWKIIEIDILVSNVPALSVCNAKYIETTVILLTRAHWYATHYLSQNRIVSSAANQRMAFVIEH